MLSRRLVIKYHADAVFDPFLAVAEAGKYTLCWRVLSVLVLVTALSACSLRGCFGDGSLKLVFLLSLTTGCRAASHADVLSLTNLVSNIRLVSETDWLLINQSH